MMIADSKFEREPATILVVEDEAIVAMDLDQQLTEMGYRVCGTADNGEDAISLARRHQPNLVLMDIVIKGRMDGVDTARHIGRGLHIPVVFLTAYNDAATVERAAQTAPYGYLTKPFQARELRAAIEVALVKSALEGRLRDSEQWFASTLRCVGDAVIATDAEARIRFMNPSAEAATGWTLNEASGRNIDEVLRLESSKTGSAAESPSRRALREDQVVDIEYAAIQIARDGTRHPVDDSAAPIRSEDGKVLGTVVVFRDVSERQRAEENLRRSEEQFRNAFDFAPAGMALVALDGRILQVNSALCALLDRSARVLRSMTQADVTNPGDAAMEREELSRLLTGQTPAVQFEKRYRSASGKDFWTLTGVSLMKEKDQPVCYLYQIHDMSQRKEAEYQLTRLAFYDSLTGLANRTRLRNEAERMLTVARRHHGHVGVVFLDLDRFKQVNDTLGHDAGDRLLQAVAQRLQACVRESDCVGRLGGDEFVVILGELRHPEDALVVTEKIRLAISEPFSILDHEVPVTPSMGVSVFPEDGHDLQKLFRCADSALYHAKAEGRNNTQCYRPELTQQMEGRMKVEAALHRALERGEFLLHYQPIFSLSTGLPVAAEALVRWSHPERGLVPPDQFIPVAEETGLIVELGEWVLQEACQEARVWARAGSPLGVSVNLSARQFKSGTLVDVVRRALQYSQIEPSLLTLEITEQSVLQDTEYNLAVISDLKGLGVRIAIDDFGVGYSSLSYLKRFAPGSIKIDRSFVRDVVDDPDDAAIVSAVIAMAKRLHIKAVAEGVENEAQRGFLLGEGCNEAQGYLYAKPAAAEEFRRWLAKRQ